MSRRVVAFLACALFASLLRCAKDPTGFYVTVTNVGPTSRYLQVKLIDPSMVSTTPPTSGMPPPGMIDSEMNMMPLSPGSHTFVVTRTSRRAQVTIEVMGSATQFGPGVVVSGPYDRATVTFEDDALFDLQMTLRQPCMGLTTPCPGTMRCNATTNMCEDSTVRNLQRHNW